MLSLCVNYDKGVEEKKNEEVRNEEEQQKKEEEKDASEEPDQEIMLKVDMHYQACSKKIARALIGLEGQYYHSLDPPLSYWWESASCKFRSSTFILVGGS